MNRFKWKNPVIYILALLVVILFGGHFKSGMAKDKTNITSTTAADGKTRISVYISDADGMTQKDFNLELLSAWKIGMVMKIKLKIRESDATPGIPDTGSRVSSQARYVRSGKMKLAFLRYSISPGSTTGVIISGIMRDKLKRVECVRETGEMISITEGACAEKIAELYGVAVDE